MVGQIEAGQDLPKKKNLKPFGYSNRPQLSHSHLHKPNRDKIVGYTHGTYT